MFFNELTNSALKKTEPKQKKTPATQLSYEVPDICTQVCSSLTRLVKCAFHSWHMHLCMHIFLSTLCSEFVTSEACLHSECKHCQADLVQRSCRLRPVPGPCSQFTEQLQPWTALLCSCSTALSRERFETLQGRFVAVGKSLSRSGCICVWSQPRWRCDAVPCYVSV